MSTEPSGDIDPEGQLQQFAKAASTKTTAEGASTARTPVAGAGTPSATSSEAPNPVADRAAAESATAPPKPSSTPPTAPPKAPLRGDEAALIAAAVAGRSKQEIADAAGVSLSTAKRRLRDPEIADAIQLGRLDQQQEAVGRLGQELPKVIDKLAELAMSDDPRIALSAIDKLLANAHRFSKSIFSGGEES